MQTVGFRCPVGFKNYPASLLSSTGTITAKRWSGRYDALDRAGETSMHESDTQRQESSEEYDYREETRFLASFLLSREEHLVEDSLKEIVSDLQRDEFIDQDQVAQATHRLMGAVDAINAVAAAQEGTHPMMEAAAGYNLIEKEDSTE